MRFVWGFSIIVFLANPVAAKAAWGAAFDSTQDAINTNAADDPAGIFQAGQNALDHGRLDKAERDFKKVLAIDPRQGGAYANLGVVYMRRKDWPKALTMLGRAEKLLPQVV